MAKIITEQHILDANTYMPIAQKATTARAVAKLAILRVDIAAKDDEAEKGISLPERYAENAETKAMYQMMLLLTYYLKQDVPENFTVKEYDEWGESAIFNQLDRHKQSKDPNVRNRVYDILDDYRELCKMIGSEIASELAAQNDPITRIGAWLSEQITTEIAAKIKDALTGMRDELKAYRESRKQKGLDA